MGMFRNAAVAAVVFASFGAGTVLAEEPTIAMVGPLTGPTASFGAQMRAGAEMVVEDLNAKGGVLGEKIKLEIGDDACDPKQAVAVANKMATMGVSMVAGHFCSGASIPASDVYEEEGILQISPASTSPLLTDAGKWNVFRVCGRDDQQGGIAGKFLSEHFKDKKIAIVHDKQAYSKGLADETKKTLNALGIEEVMYETVTPGEKDYSALVSKMKAEGVEVLYYGGYHTEAGLIVRQMRDQGMDTILMAGDALVTDEYWSITGEAGEGTLMTFSPDPARDPKNADLVKKFEDKGVKPEGYTLYTYGAVQAWVQAAEKVGSLDEEKIADVLKAETFETVLGEISFDAKGDVTAPGYVVYEWKGGKYDYFGEGK